MVPPRLGLVILPAVVTSRAEMPYVSLMARTRIQIINQIVQGEIMGRRGLANITRSFYRGITERSRCTSEVRAARG